MSEIVIVFKGDFNETEHGIDMFTVMDKFNKHGIDIHSFKEGVFYAVFSKEDS